MATALHLDGTTDNTAIPRIVRGAILLGAIQAVTVLLVSLVNRVFEGTIDHTLTGILVAVGIAITCFLPGTLTRPRTIDGIAAAAGIGLGATVTFLVLDVTLLQNIGTYTNRWQEVGGGSNWWYHPVWWMAGTFLAWMGAWILANFANREATAPVGRGILLVAGIALVVGAIAAAVHFPLARWNVATFAVAVLPSLVLANVVSSRGARRR